MTHLAISSSKAPSSGNAANTLQANIAADPQMIDAQSGVSFAFLLAQQIGETNLPPLDSAQTAIAIDSNAVSGNADQISKDVQDQTATVNPPADPTNTLAAMLIQLPAQNDRGQKIEAQQPSQPFALSSLQKTGPLNAMQPFVASSSHETGLKEVATGSENSQPIQPPALNHLPSAAVNLPIKTSPAISTPLGTNGWADEFSQKISWISTQQNQVAELHLNPPNLGPLDVVLKITDNQATALFTSPHGAVRDAVENALPKLREILADNGIMLGNTTVSDQPPRDRSMDGFMNQNSGTTPQHEFPSIASESAGLPSATAQTGMVRRHNGMVDTFA